MRIGQINTNPDWGGGENQILHLVQHLAPLGVEVTLFAHPEGELLRRARESGCDVRPLPSGGRKPSARKAAELVAGAGIDLLHVHDSASASLGNRVGRHLDIPVVLSRRVASPLRRNPLSQWKYSRRHFEAVIAISQTVRDVFLRTSRFPADDVYVVPTGVDIGELDAVERDHAWRRTLDGGPVVGGVGKLSPKKNWEFLVRVAARLAEEGERIHWVVAGDGGEREALEALILELGLESQVHLLGFRPDAHRILKSLDVLFFPSIVEGASVTVRECMVLGTPVVAVKADGTMESLAGHGWGVDDGDVETAVRSVREALGDTPLRRERVAGARRHAVEYYSYDRTAAETLEVYRKVLAR